MKQLIIAGREFNSRLFLGTGKFNSNELMEQSLLASGTEMVTVAMKRIDMDNKEDDMLKHIIHPHIQLLPNTSGVRTSAACWLGCSSLWAGAIGRRLSLPSPAWSPRKTSSVLWASCTAAETAPCIRILPMLSTALPVIPSWCSTCCAHRASRPSAPSSAR